MRLHNRSESKIVELAARAKALDDSRSSMTVVSEWAQAQGVQVSGVSPPIYPDFCHVDYHASATGVPTVRPVVLLLESFAEQGVLEPGVALLRALADTLGELRTVWAVKLTDGRVSWELYVYNRAGIPTVAPEQLARAMAGSLSFAPPQWLCSVAFDAYSVDIDRELLQKGGSIDAMHIYGPNSASCRQGGISSLATTDAVTKENEYYVFEMPRDQTQVSVARSESFHLGGALDILEPVVSRLSDSPLVHLAHKPDTDGLYFSRIASHQLVWFLGHVTFPPAMVAAIDDHRLASSGLLFDVGIDVRRTPEGTQLAKAAVFVCA